MQTCPQIGGGTGEHARLTDRVAVSDHDVEQQPRRMRFDDPQMRFGRIAGGLTGLRRQIQDHDAASRRTQQAPGHLGHQQMGQHAGVERTRAEHHPFGPLDGFERRPARGGPHGLQAQAADPTGRGGHRSLTADLDDRRRLTGVETGHLRNDVDTRVRQRQHPPGGSQQPGSKIERVHRRAVALGERAEHQIADGMTGQWPASPEAVLEQLRPGGRPTIGTGERGQRHPQITHGQRSQLRPEPTR